MLPRVTLSEMLFEVNKWTGFVQLLHLLGFMFAPRIRDIADSILYLIPGTHVSQCLTDVAFRSINTKSFFFDLMVEEIPFRCFLTKK